MNHAMTCEEAKQALDAAFDDGVVLASSAAAHVETCPGCTAYGDALVTLDLSLCQAPLIQAAPALVARIQVEIASQPRYAPGPWAYPVGVAAAVLILAALGPAVNRGSWIGTMEAVVRGALLPEWDFLKDELMAIPAGVAVDYVELGQWSDGAWSALNGWLVAFGSGAGPWLWTLFILCVVAACALDGMEWMSRRIHRS